MSELLGTIKSPGLFTTIQDGGRPGFRHLGVPVSGYMDREAAELANRLVGNQAQAPLLEITLTGPTIQFHQFGALGIAGADLSPSLNGVPLPLHETIYYARGDILSFDRRVAGFRTYLAFAGALEAEMIMGSLSTHVSNGWGGIRGGTLKKGDQLFISDRTSPKRTRLTIERPASDTVRLRPSLEFDRLPASAQQNLFSQPWTLAPESNRSGIRLVGEPLATPSISMISSPTDVGIVQLPPSGLPIILMPDSAAIGGYPRIGAISQSDLPLLAQKAPGETIRFQAI